MTAPNVVPLRPVDAADHLERLARRPLQPRRNELRLLAKRLRALEALGHPRADDQQLSRKEVA